MKTVIALLSLMAALSQGVSLAQEPSKTPILRIETGMHSAAIITTAVDPANRFLVTVSVDKTLRIWELQSGTMIRVIRPPIGSGNAGHLYALAISPDGNTIACGGHTAERPEDESIYVIDRASGSIIRRIQPTSEVIGLVYSKDGSLLAASLSKNGIKLYETQTYRLADEDKQYGGAGYGARSAEFTANGTLITSSGDGYIRLYDVRSGLRLIAKKKGSGDKLPAGIRVSPGGDKIAVGFFSGIVTVLSATDLSLLYSPDTSRVIHPNLVPCLLTVDWSADGRDLFAAGRFVVAGKSLIRKWAGAGRGPYQDLPASRGVTEVTSILSLKDGAIVFATIEPAFGALNVDGTKRFFRGPENVTVQTDNSDDIKRVVEGFLVSADAKTIEFGDGNSTVRFSLADKRLEQSPAPLDALRPPLTQSSGLRITDWFLKNYPKLDGKALRIDNGTQSLSLSLCIAPDRNHFLLSTTNSLIFFDRNGVTRWVLPSGGGGCVNISGDGRFAVTSQGDGTIHWYRITDGRELLALFPHGDRKR